MAKSLREYLLSDRVYRYLQIYVRIIFPVLGVMEITFPDFIPGLKNLIEAIAIFALCVGIFLELVTRTFDGQIVISENGKGGKLYTLDFGEDDPRDIIEGRSMLIFRVRPKENPEDDS